MLTIELMTTTILSITLLFSLIIFFMNALRINDGFNFFTTSLTSLFIFTITTLYMFLLRMLMDVIDFSVTSIHIGFYIVIVIFLLFANILSWRTRKYMQATGQQCQRK